MNKINKYIITIVFKNNPSENRSIPVLKTKGLKDRLDKIKTMSNYRKKDHIINGGDKGQFYFYHTKIY